MIHYELYQTRENETELFFLYSDSSKDAVNKVAEQQPQGRYIIFFCMAGVKIPVTEILIK